MDFYIGQIFEEEYPVEAADWCNSRNDCYINEIAPSGNVRRFQITEIVYTLEDAKRDKYEEALTKAKLFIENEAVYQFDENNSIEATDGNIGKMTANVIALQTGTFDEVQWTSKEDNVLTLDAQDVATILIGLGAIQSVIWNVQFVGYKNAINNAQTVQEVQQIVINYAV